MRSICPVLILLLLFSVALPGCQRAYYRTMETLGWHKRDILVDRVVAARDQQEEAKEEFANALERFMEVTQLDGGELASRYRELDRSYQRSADEAQAVRERIEAVEDVAEALFSEWEAELDQYESADLRRTSERQLRETRQRYQELIGAMNEAASRMDPVLAALHDQVLFLKHNLNARAVASLQETAANLQADVQRLIEEMEQSIERANAFIAEMGVSG